MSMDNRYQSPDNKVIGKPYPRLDAHDKAIGRAKYVDDLCDKGALVTRILHSTVANGIVKSIDTSEAEKIPGVVRVFTLSLIHI